jgi:hypothetical protein
MWHAWIREECLQGFLEFLGKLLASYSVGTEVKNEWSCTSILPISLLGGDKESFTFLLLRYQEELSVLEFNCFVALTSSS